MKKKVIILGLVGCLTLGNVSIATEPKNVEDGKVEVVSLELQADNKIKLETKTIIKDYENATVNVEIPVIKGLKDIKYQKQLNDFLESYADKAIKEFVEIAKKSGVESEMKISYDVKSKDDILSFVIDTYTYTGGANGISRRYYYNIDTNENKIIKLDDLFKEGSNFKNIINDEINKQIEEQITTGEKVYFEGEEGFKTIKDEQSFYINKDGNLVITFQMYEIAPRYMGHPEFEIPKSSLVNILKDEKIENNRIVSFNKVIINDKELKLEKPMFKSEKGTVMIPLREIADVLDFKVTWDQENGVVNINKGPVWAGAYIGKDKYFFSKAFVFLEEEAQLIKGTTFVPINFIDEVIKGEISINNGVLNIKY